MHNLQTRISTISGWFSYATMVLLLCCAISHYHLVKTDSSPQLYNLEPRQVIFKPRRLGNTKPTMARIRFDMEADLTSLFNWNTKMLFVSVLAEFKSGNTLNYVCVWDDVIWDKEDAMISLKNKQGDYPIHDINDKLKGLNANLTLQYEVVPWVGFLYTDRIVKENGIKFVETATKANKAKKSNK